MTAIDALAADARPAPIEARSGVRLWLILMAGLVFAMVLIGGATRLTESGLSITQWKPVTGVIPPLDAAQWRAEFDRYKQIPQFSELNPDMTLDGFKIIYAWEWSHRLLARIVGAAFILPGLWFWARGRLRGALGRQVAVATGLLALEPIVGWWMVSSGLSQRAEVAQQRLALHLLIAAATFGALIYAAVGLGERQRSSVAFARLRRLRRRVRRPRLWPARARRPGRGPARRAHLQHLADDGFALDSRRGVPVALADGDAQRPGDGAIRSSDGRLCRRCVRARPGSRRLAGAPGSPLARRATVLAGAATLQAVLGIATLLYVAPLGLALVHQAFALVVFGLAVAHWRATQMEQRA